MKGIIDMKHSVIFKNTVNKWDNALPLGNSIFGCMLYYENNRLFMPMNHYEIYYNIRKHVLPSQYLANGAIEKDPGAYHRQRKEQADHNIPNGNEPYTFYGTWKRGAFNRDYYAIGSFSASFPLTGDVEFTFSKDLDKADSNLSLFVQDAKTVLSLEKDEKKLDIETIVARKDCIINKFKQSDEGLVDTVHVVFNPFRDLDLPKVDYKQVDNHTFVYTVTNEIQGPDSSSKTFVFSGAINLIGAEGTLVESEFGADIKITKAGKDFTMLTAVVTEWKYSDPENDVVTAIREYESNLQEMYKEHKEYWDDFFTRGNISIPDKFLENIYYVNMYTLDCSSGKDGIMKHQACGLNGLWDVKRPNLWGSKWYWDANIQASFAGAFSSNRLDWAKIFSDGLLCYVENAKKFARDKHNFTGVAADYPHPFYYSIMPWCAQYMWFLYEYSLDTEYLRNDAYPLFVQIAENLLQVFEYDEETDTYNVYPDISPEQGPLAHNTTITVASAKYLLKFTLESAKILGDNSPLLEKFRHLMERLPKYALSKPNNMHGVHYNDSPDTPDNQWLRHPSLLMPLYPIGEFDFDTDKEAYQYWSNTVDHIEDNSEISIFACSWLAAAAARLGRGQTALRLLYERGIDHMLRSNGLTAEETDHFINYCLMPRQMLYYPCMMEFTGEMLAAVNEMLLQSHNGIIRIFPAIPDGDPEMERMHKKGYPYAEYIDRYNKYDAWENARFDRLLAKGAFEISAELKDNKLAWVYITSKKGGSVRLTSPFMDNTLKVFCDGKTVEFSLENNVITFETEEGKSYTVSADASAYTPFTFGDEYNTEVLERESYTKRRLFVGENEDTEYYKAIDNFIRSWYLGNTRMDNHTLYKFDFGPVKDKKYAWAFMRQAYVADRRAIFSLPFIHIDEDSLAFTYKRGFGFNAEENIKAVDRGTDDILRRDFVEGTEPVEFIIENPRGQYEMLVVSGDNEEDSVTIVEAVNGRKAGGEVVKKGRYQCKLLPLVNESDDEYIKLRISTIPGYKWKINTIFLNMIKGY